MNHNIKNLKAINDDKLYFEWLKPKQTLITKIKKLWRKLIFIKN